MADVVEHFPGVMPDPEEKEDLSTMPDKASVNKILSDEFNATAGSVKAMARMFRMNAIVCGAPYPGEGGWNNQAWVFWNALHANGLPYCIKSTFSLDLSQEWAGAVERIEQGGDTDGTASSASGMMGIYAGVLPAAGFNAPDQLKLNSSGQLATYTGGALAPIGYVMSSSYAYVDVGGRVRADNSTINFTTSGALTVKSGGNVSFGNVYAAGTVTIAGQTTCLSALRASTVYSASGLTLSGSTVTMGCAFTAKAATTLQAALTGTTAYFSGAAEFNCVHIEGTSDWIGGICADTVDGSDGKQVFLCGGGYTVGDQGLRGGTVMAYGNEDTISPGCLFAEVGKTGAAYFALKSNGTTRLKLDHGGDMFRYTNKGINYAPGSDADTDIITIDVTGAPRLWWDESEDQFTLTKGLSINPGADFKMGGTTAITSARVGMFTGIGANYTPTANYLIAAKSDQDDYTATRLSNADAGTSARCYHHLNNAGTNGYLALYGSGYTTVGAKQQNALVLEHTHANGINLAASNASGGIKLYTGGTAAANLRMTLDSAGDLTIADGLDVILDTTTGTKIGTATGQKLGFYNATPVDQPVTVADPTGGATIDAESRTAIDAIIDRLQELGLIA